MSTRYSLVVEHAVEEKAKFARVLRLIPAPVACRSMHVSDPQLDHPSPCVPAVEDHPDNFTVTSC